MPKSDNSPCRTGAKSRHERELTSRLFYFSSGLKNFSSDLVAPSALPTNQKHAQPSVLITERKGCTCFALFT